MARTGTTMATARTRMLGRDEERELLGRWRGARDPVALNTLIQAHRPLVLKIAGRYRGFGMPVDDLVQEGFAGLMEAANRFDLQQEVRFATYAHWWAKAAVQDYVLRNWSSVRPVTSSRQKRAFFAMKRLLPQMSPDGRLTSGQEIELAERIGLSAEAAADMARRASTQDTSLNAQAGPEGDMELQDLLADDGPTPEEAVTEADDRSARSAWLAAAIERLDPRERAIIVERHLREDGPILADLGQRFGVSKERVRQLEKRALRKLHDAVMHAAAHSAHPCSPDGVR